jgi:hypothetical protein
MGRFTVHKAFNLSHSQTLWLQLTERIRKWWSGRLYSNEFEVSYVYIDQNTGPNLSQHSCALRNPVLFLVPTHLNKGR